MSTLTVVVWEVLPLLAVMVMVRVPVEAKLDALTVIVEVPEPVTEDGLKVIVSPLPWPDAVRETAELKPPVPVMVMVEVPDEPRSTVREVGEAETLNPAATLVTVRETVVVSVSPPPVPVMVMG
jgi:hypothetical protein